MKNKLVAIGIFVVLALVCALAGGSSLTYGTAAFLGFAAAAAAARVLDKRHPPATGETAGDDTPENPLARSAAREVNESTFSIGAEVLGTRYRRSERNKFEQIVDGILDEYIKLIRSRLDAHTVAVFFPTDDGGYTIRRFSSRCDYINKNAIIYPGVGVIGSFLKDGLKQLNLQEIVTDSMTLYYYEKDAGIRSLMASPIIANGVKRGTIIVDSTRKKHFSDEDHGYLSGVATLLGQTVFSTYMLNEHRLSHLRLTSMSKIEKDFFSHLELDAILDRMLEIIPFAISCDRLTITLRGDDHNHAVIRRTWGRKIDGFSGITFPLSGKNLISLVYAKNIFFYRNFADDHYEVRYCEQEPATREFLSFLAIPFGTDECIGTLLLESLRGDAYTEAHCDLLLRLTTSASLAIEKVKIIEQANALATHDGLTGLINHRQFQILLRNEINRAIRYAEPLTLAIGDIDFFKKLNDTYGHPFGDTVLKGVAERLSESIREQIDIAARYGGEEFALIFVKTGIEQARETTERIRDSLEKMHFRTPRGEQISITMSFGIATLDEHVRASDMLIKRADKALYRAKGNGRNRIEVF